MAEVTGSSMIDVMRASTSVESDEEDVEPGEDELLLLLCRRRRLLLGDGEEGGGKLKGQQWAVGGGAWH